MSIFGTSSSQPGTPGATINPRVFDKSGDFQTGSATHYGPNPLYIPGSEAGYQPNSVGVGCSNGPNDPNWTALLAKGVYNVSRYQGIDQSTVWPTTPTVAVSQYAWKRNEICWKTVKIRSALNHSLAIEAVVVDFCPTQGCLWDHLGRAWNSDVYGVFAFQALGGSPDAGSIPVEIAWPPGITPDTSHSHRNVISFSSLFLALALIL